MENGGKEWDRGEELKGIISEEMEVEGVCVCVSCVQLCVRVGSVCMHVGVFACVCTFVVKNSYYTDFVISASSPRSVVLKY